MFISVEQKLFKGYGRVISEVYSTQDIMELSDIPQLNVYKGNTFACKIEWMSREQVDFEQVKFIRNSHNNNLSVNMCKEFHV